MPPTRSPFFDPGPIASHDSLGIIHLKRDHLVPTLLKLPSDDASDCSKEHIANTRFGSFPHSTLLGLSWGSQVLASNVNTGKGARVGSKKRKRDLKDDPDVVSRDEEGDSTDIKPKEGPVVASTGFAHLLPPTPEAWTISLPHRTQVVYTPDYSYVLQRLQVRPGNTILEAGAGSGSFSHASARAVFNGYPDEELQNVSCIKKSRRKRRVGNVFSYEYHESRASTLKKEIKDHGLDSIITITHRDVYQEGFCIDGKEVEADAIFLDLPAPWLALKHLARAPLSKSTLNAIESPPRNDTLCDSPSSQSPNNRDSIPFRSPLNPKATVRICTFSPCIEQVIKTVATLRELGWLEIDMVEMQHRRIDVRRERVGISEEGVRGGNPSPSTVEEALFKLRDHGEKHEAYQEVRRRNAERARNNKEAKNTTNGGNQHHADYVETVTAAKAKRIEKNMLKAKERPLFDEGRIVHKTEPELKTHTSYLVFAILPRSWTEEDEALCKEKWSTEGL